MRIGIISDSHGNTNAIDQAVKVAGEIDFWLHAGDLINDAEYLRMAYDAEVVNVAGNCDWGLSFPPEGMETGGFRSRRTDSKLQKRDLGFQ